MEKLDLIYCLDNLEQFEYFKISVKSLLLKNPNNKIIVNVLIADNKDIISKVQNLFNELEIKHNVIVMNDTLAENYPIHSNAMMWWFLAPKILNLNEGYSLYLDNDTILNFDLSLIFEDVKHIETNVFNGYKYGEWISKVYKYSVAINLKRGFRDKKRVLNNFFNQGVVLIDNTLYQDKIDLNSLVRSINKYKNINKISSFFGQNYSHNDEVFILSYFGNLISPSLPSNYNQSIHLTLFTPQDIGLEEYILHYFGPHKKLLFQILNNNYFDEQLFISFKEKLKIHWVKNNKFIKVTVSNEWFDNLELLIKNLISLR